MVGFKMSIAATPTVTIALDVPARTDKQAQQNRPSAVQPETPAVPDSIPDDAVQAAEEVLNRAFEKRFPSNQRLSLDRDEVTSRVVFKSIDRESGETIKQFPTEEMLRQIARMRDVTGLALKVDA